MRSVGMLSVAVALPAALLAAPGASVATSREGPPTTDEIPADWIALVDDTQQISIAVPPTWTDVDTVPDLSGQPWISATTDADLFFPPAGEADTYSVPGILYRAFPVADDPASWLETSLLHDVCMSEPIEEFRNDVFDGTRQSFTECGGTDSSITQVAATRVDGEFTVLLLVQLVGEPFDEETLDYVLRSMS